MTDTASTDDVAMADEASLELGRWGIGFVRPDAERHYRAWQVSRDFELNLAANAIAIGMWVTGALTMALTEHLGPWVALVLAPAAWLAGYRYFYRRDPSTSHLLALGFVVPGLVPVVLFHWHFGFHSLAVAVFAINAFFVAVLMRFPPGPVFAALTPVAIAELIALVQAHQRHELGELETINAMVVLGAVAVPVMLANVAIDRRARHSFRQERIIEAQKGTIARQQELLKRELSHQVAERSRELGAVLAKSDVTLDVRALTAGERFAERYRIVAVLGAGGMGVVYEVERMTDGQHLALKAVVGEVSGASAARFAREAEIGARVHHSNLVAIVDVGVSSGVPFLAMELVRGGSLEAQRARFGDVAWALAILRQIAEGLAALHDAGVVHRDLKPANVLLAGDETLPIAKISDFGISRFGALDDAASIDPHAATMGPGRAPKGGLVTGTGVIMGTPLYMAPEAARGGRALDASADVFALGIIAYEMLTGRVPFRVPAVVLAMAEQPTPAPPVISDARVPGALRELVLQCLSGDSRQRPRVRALLPALDGGA